MESSMDANAPAFPRQHGDAGAPKRRLGLRDEVHSPKSRRSLGDESPKAGRSLDARRPRHAPPPPRFFTPLDGAAADGDVCRRNAMMELGNGLSAAEYDVDALCVREAELSMYRRVGTSEGTILHTQCCLANSYQLLGRPEALQMRQDVYAGYVRLYGEEHRNTLISAHNYADSLNLLQQFEKARSLLRKTIPAARRFLGESDEVTLRMKQVYAQTLYKNDATLDDLHESVETLEDTERTAQRVLGGAHPLTECLEEDLRNARAALAAREAP